MLKKIASIITMSIILVFLFSAPLSAASGSARVFYNTNLTIGVTSSINTKLNGTGYSSTLTADPTTAAVLNSFGNNKVVHVSSHAAPGVLALLNGNVTANQISNQYTSLPTTKFVFLAGCKTAVSSTTNGDLDNNLYSLGVDSTLAFSQNISASTSTDGIHIFISQFYNQSIDNLYSTSTSASNALSYIYAVTGQYYGANSMVLKGNTYIY